MLEDWGRRCHRLSGSQWYTALVVLEARRPATYGDPAAAVYKQVCAYRLTMASTETELSLLRVLMVGATWTSERARVHSIVARGTHLYCVGPQETPTRLLWECPCWHAQRAPWLPLVLVEATPLPMPALPSTWLPCLRATGLLPAALVAPSEQNEACRLMYCPYGMYLAVLSAHMEVEVTARRDAGAGPSVFAAARKRPPDARRGYPWWQRSNGLLPTAPLAPLLVPRVKSPLDWPWKPSFMEVTVQSATSITWFLGPGHVMYMELALDARAHAGRALPAPGDHRWRGVAHPVRTKGQVLKQAMDRLQPHMQTGSLLRGKEVWMAHIRHEVAPPPPPPRHLGGTGGRYGGEVRGGGMGGVRGGCTAGGSTGGGVWG